MTYCCPYAYRLIIASIRQMNLLHEMNYKLNEYIIVIK